MATLYFRTDGWVKSAQGPAVPGAQIYVCTQPANDTALPPTPLANIFSDVNGLVPITQPIITDGFGHYDFYAQANVYTIVVGLGGIVQQVYPDQSVGGASGSSGGGGGTALSLQVDGTANTNQLLLNLQGEQSVAVEDLGNGTITITGAVFQTSGVSNTLQTKLNLIAGANIALSSDINGGVTISGASGSAALDYFLGPGRTVPMDGTDSNAPSLSSGATVVNVIRFFLPGSITVSKVSVVFTNALPGSSNFGIYSVSGNLLIDSGAFNNSSSMNVAQTLAVSPTLLPPGEYFLAWASTQPSSQVSGTTATNVPGISLMGSGTVPKWGTAAGAYNGASLPASLGAVTAFTVSTLPGGFPHPLFE